eukprot:1092975-Alexandrium_andersonii.AAC.1
MSTSCLFSCLSVLAAGAPKWPSGISDLGRNIGSNRLAGPTERAGGLVSGRCPGDRPCSPPRP